MTVAENKVREIMAIERRGEKPKHNFRGMEGDSGSMGVGNFLFPSKGLG